MNDDRSQRADALADEAARLFDAVEAVTGLGASSRQTRSRPPRQQSAQRPAPPVEPDAAGWQPPADADDASAGPAEANEPPSSHPGGEHPTTCTWCPVCRGVDTLRAVDPDTVARLADAVGMLATALGELAGTLRERLPVPRHDDRGRPGDPGGPGEGDGPARGHWPAPSSVAARDGLDATWSRGGGGGRGTAYDIPVLGEEEN